MFGRITLAAALALCGVRSSQADSVPVLNSLTINDNRIMNSFGIYPVAGPPENAMQLVAGHFNTGHLAATLMFKTANGDRQIGGLNIVRGKGTDGAFVKIAARNSGGYFIRMTGNFVNEGSGRYAFDGFIKGPDINTTFTASMVPVDPNRGFLVVDREVTDEGFRWKAYLASTDYYVYKMSFTRPAGNTVFRAQEPSTPNVLIPGNLSPAGSVYGWETRPANLRVKVGRASYLVPSTRVALLVDSLNL